MLERPIYEALQAFSKRDLQTFKNIIVVLNQNNISIDTALKYIWYTTMSTETKIIKPCPECTDDMHVYSVNDTSCTQVGGRNRSQWYCATCGYAEYSKKTPMQVAKRLLREVYPQLSIDTKYQKEFLEWEVAMKMVRPFPEDCPKCNKTMYLHKISTPTGNRNRYGYKSLWFCEHCGYEKYTKNTMIEEIVKLRRI